MQEPIGVADVALMLHLEAESVLELARRGGLPHERHGSAYVFHRPSIACWRSSIEPTDTIFTNIDAYAESLRKELAGRGISVKPLWCSICVQSAAAQPSVAARACMLCGQPVCLPHSLHYLKNGKPIDQDPDVACNTCFEVSSPATWS